jgi:hypothetical protein
MSARRVNRRRGRGGWIPQLAHDVGLALVGFAYLVALVAILSFVADAMGVLEAAAVAAVPVRGRLLASIVRRFRADMAVAAGLPEDPPPPLAETLARLDEMHARVQEMIAAAPPRTERTRAGDREEAA